MDHLSTSAGVWCQLPFCTCLLFKWFHSDSDWIKLYLDMIFSDLNLRPTVPILKLYFMATIWRTFTSTHWPPLRLKLSGTGPRGRTFHPSEFTGMRFATYSCYSTITCKDLLNGPHSKLGHHCAENAKYWLSALLENVPALCSFAQFSLLWMK